MISIAENLEKTARRIREAAEKAGRDPAGVRLLAVSKKKPASAIREAAEWGQVAFGENYVQEALDKMEALGICRSLNGISSGRCSPTRRGLLPAILTGCTALIGSRWRSG